MRPLSYLKAREQALVRAIQRAILDRETDLRAKLEHELAMVRRPLRRLADPIRRTF